MSQPNQSPPLRVLLLHTSAGGGHTSAAKAIREALEHRYGAAIQCELIDALKDYAPRPLDIAPEVYTQLLKAPHFWGQFYDLGDGQRRSRIINNSIARYTRRATAAMLTEHPADIIVSTYHFISPPVLNSLQRLGLKTPLITVVTDLVTIPPVWFDARATLTIVATEPALHQAILGGIPRERLAKVGLPVSRRFSTTMTQAAAKQKLGLPAEQRIVLIMAGGAGVGPLGVLGKAVASAGLNALPVIITGKNRRLAQRLRQESWSKNAMIYDFVDNIATFMRAADVLVTKAGPGTIAEALNMHLPMILYSSIPGQEEGNVEYVTHSGAGYWAPKPHEIITTLQYLFSDPEVLADARAAAKHLASPQATDEIAKLIYTTKADSH